jgi:hypothetical protein
LVGSFLTNRPVRVHIYKAGVQSPVRGVSIMEDVHKVLMGGQWFFNKHMLIIGAMNGEEEMSQVQMYTVLFRIQIHTLSTRHMTEKVGKQLAEVIGKFLLHIPTQVLHIA